MPLSTWKGLRILCLTYHRTAVRMIHEKNRMPSVRYSIKKIIGAASEDVVLCGMEQMGTEGAAACTEFYL